MSVQAGPDANFVAGEEVLLSIDAGQCKVFASSDIST